MVSKEIVARVGKQVVAGVRKAEMSIWSLSNQGGRAAKARVTCTAVDKEELLHKVLKYLFMSST